MKTPFKWLLSKLWQIQEWWCSKDPKQKWDLLHDFGRVMCESIGIRIFSDMRNYWYSASCGVCAFLYYLLEFYTIQYYLRRNQFIEAIECISLVCAVFGVSVRSEVMISLSMKNVEAYIK